jgi:membrane associated rhomboid family serine protease
VFFIPYATDAVLYHRPIGTFLLIAANIVCFLLTGVSADTDLARNFALEFGTGMHPLEWISCHFLHYDIFHLLANMFFLFIFGIIIEGKIGTIPFLLLYFTIGWMGASLAQAMVQWETDTLATEAGGASLVVFGLIAVSMFWAPKNEVSFWGFIIYIYMPRIITFEASVMGVGIFYFSLNLLVAWLMGFSMGGAMGHVLGALVGAGIGVAMLKLNWVDCEGWDVFSLMKEDPRQKAMEYYKEELYAAYPHATPTEDLPDLPVSKQPSGSRNQRKLVKRLLKRMRNEDVEAALEARTNLAAVNGDHLLSREEQDEFVRFLLKQGQQDDAILELQKFVARFPEDSDRHNLKLCELLLTHRKRPSEAMHILATMTTDHLEDKLFQKRQKLIDRADQMLASGMH